MRLPGLRHRSPPIEADVAVVGSGLPAVAAALELSRRGARVVVLGPAPEEARTRGLGLLLLGPGRPYVRVAREIGRESARLVWAAGCESHLRLRAFLDEAGRDCAYAPRGSFLLAAERREAEELAESEDMLRDDGFPGEFIDHYMLETRFDLSGFPGAYWAAEDAELDDARLRGALGDGARAAGVAFAPGPVRAVSAGESGVRIEAGDATVRAGAAVVATDGAARLLPELQPLLRPAAPDRLRTALLPGAVLPTALRTADGRIAWRGGEGTILLSRLGATGAAEEEILDSFATRIPVETATAQRWSEPGEVSADGLPLVGRLPGRPLAVACGFGALSAGLAFAAARWVADALLLGNDPTPEPLRATRPPSLV